MKVKCTKVMAKFINENVNLPIEATLVSLTESEYKYYVSTDIFSAEDYGDYSYTTGKYQAIQITYPHNYYAMPNYLTTKQLLSEFNRRNVSDVKEFISMLKYLIEI